MTENGIIALLIIAALLFLWFFWIRIPVQMARKRGRSVIGWIAVFWLLSPLWGIVLLLIVGDSKEKLAEDIVRRLKNE